MELGGDVLKKWHVLRNMWKSARTESPNAMANQYDALLEESINGHLLESRIYESAFVKQVIDFGAALHRNSKSEKLLDGLDAVVKEVLGNLPLKEGV